MNTMSFSVTKPLEEISGFARVRKFIDVSFPHALPPWRRPGCPAAPRADYHQYVRIVLGHAADVLVRFLGVAAELEHVAEHGDLPAEAT